MRNLASNNRINRLPIGVSAYDDEGVKPEKLSHQKRRENFELVIQRFFVTHEKFEIYKREAVVRSINPGSDFALRLQEQMDLADGGFGLTLIPPSQMVVDAFREYALTELGAVALARLIAWDNRFINLGWRNRDGSLTDAGINAFGAGQWRPFRIASNGEDSDNVTPSGVLLLPDRFQEEYYSTGDVAHPFAVLHHEIKAHVLPLKEAKGLVPGREMGLICMRLESEVLREIGFPERKLNWGRDGGTLNHTLFEPSEGYFQGLVRYDDNGRLIEIEPETASLIGPARVESDTSLYRLLTELKVNQNNNVSRY